MSVQFVLAAALAAAGLGPSQAQPAPASAADAMAAPAATTETATVVAPPAPPPKLVLTKGTMVRLMVTKEVNSRDNHPGDRFVLRVDEDVKVGNVTVVPTGAKGWGEVVDVKGSGAAGKSGKISTRLLYIEANGQKVELDGDRQSAGSGGTSNVVGGVVAFGPFGLFMKGGNASLKAGEILNGYTLSDASFDLSKPVAQ